MAAVPRDRNDHFLVALVVAEDLLEAVAQVVEVLVLRNAALENPRFYFQGRRLLDEGADVALGLVHAHVGVLFFQDAAVVVFEALEVGLAAAGHLVCFDFCSIHNPIHAEPLPVHVGCLLQHFVLLHMERIVDEARVIVVVLARLHVRLVDCAWVRAK